MRPDIEALVRATAARHNLPVAFVSAIVRVESSGDPAAMRYEPAFFERYVSGRGHRVWPGCSRGTEERLRAFSFGLMQIMGQTAREIGFDRVFLAEMLDPEINLEYGCRYLARQYDRYQDLEATAAAYNAGSATRATAGRWRNQEYVDKIRRAGGL